MKFSVEWIQEYCKFDLSIDELVERLTIVGLEVEGHETVGPDVSVELEITANRPDALSLIGIARDLAAVTGGTLVLPKAQYAEINETAASQAFLAVEAADLCPRYSARIVTDVKVGPAPDWLRRRLEAIGLRPVNNVVDITNYVLMETGQPLHAFDLDKLNEKKIDVRKAIKGERIRLIDDKTYTLDPSMLVIADAARPVAVAGVMGGADTQVTEGTTAVLLESAEFDPIVTRRAARALKVSTDSSYRFERGVDPAGVDFASRRACALLHELCGGKIAKGVLYHGERHIPTRSVTLRPERIGRILGVDVPVKEAASLLETIGFEVMGGRGGPLNVHIPSFRRDVEREIDLIEEVARLIGYDKIPESKSIPIHLVLPSQDDRIARATKDLFLADGYQETMTLTFVSPSVAKLSPWSTEEPLTVLNPINKEENALRLSLLPALLRTRKVNQDAGQSDVRLFELGAVHLPVAGQKLPTEQTTLAALIDTDKEHTGFFALKGTLEALLERLQVADPVEFQPGTWTALKPGVSADVYLGRERIGFLGEVTRETARVFGLKSTPAYLEFRFDRLVERTGKQTGFAPLPKFPAIERELSLVVDEGVQWKQVDDTIRTVAPSILTTIAYEDTYRGKQIDKGKKAFLVRLTFRAADRTLTSDEADNPVAEILKALAKQCNATLRS